MNALHDLPVVVIGAGPVGLAAAAHLPERGLPFPVLEAGDSAGAAVAEWGHVRVFSPWRYNIDPAARRLLDDAGWAAPDPEAAAHRRRAGRATTCSRWRSCPRLAPHVRYGARVTAISRLGFDRVRTAGRDDRPVPRAPRRRRRSCSPARSSTPPAPGAPRTCSAPTACPPTARPTPPACIGPRAARRARRRPGPLRRPAHPRRRRRPLRRQHPAGPGRAGRQEPGTRITWAIRGRLADRAVRRRRRRRAARPAARSAPAARATSTPAGSSWSPASPCTRSTPTGDGSSVVSATPPAARSRHRRPDRRPPPGSAPTTASPPNCAWTSTRSSAATRALAPLIDPNEHSCGTVPPHGVDELAHPEPGYYAVGMKSYGRAPTFLHGHRLRAGPLRRRRPGRRLGRRPRRPARPARDRRVQQ